MTITEDQLKEIDKRARQVELDVSERIADVSMPYSSAADISTALFSMRYGIVRAVGDVLNPAADENADEDADEDAAESDSSDDVDAL